MLKNKTNNTLKVFISLLFIFIEINGVSYSYCGEDTNFSALAIIGKEARLAEINLNSHKGSGVFVKLNLTYGPETQRSIMNAYKVARELSNKTCKFQVGFSGVEEEIYGPSAGAMFALKFYEIMENKHPSKKYIATGGIDEEGNILPVGGVYEKMKAFINSDYKVMFYNTGDKRLNLILYSYVKKFGKEAYPIENITEAINYLYKNKEINIEESINKEKVPEGLEKSKYDAEFMKNSSEEYIKEEELIMNSFSFPFYYEKYLKKSIEKQKILFNKGYYYSSANEAFNELSFLKAYMDVEYNREKELYKEVSNCINTTKFYEEREDNVEEITGAKARYYRAKEVIDNYEWINEDDLYYEKLDKMMELEKADMWCEAAKEWNIKGKGKFVDYEDLFVKIGELNINKSQMYGRFKELLEDKEYLTFLYEYSFIKGNDSEIRENYSTTWGNIYASQAEYLKKANEEYEEVAIIANNLEDLFNDLEYTEINNKPEKEVDKCKTLPEKKEGETKDIYYVVFVIGFIGGVLSCMLLKLLRK